MLEGKIMNMPYIVCCNMGINTDRFLEELEKLNNQRSPYAQMPIDQKKKD
jgi:hypothetical protein